MELLRAQPLATLRYSGVRHQTVHNTFELLPRFALLDLALFRATTCCARLCLRSLKERGLQLHLLSALGEIWRKDVLPKEEGAARDFVGLSVVVSAQGREGGHINVEGRHLLEDSGETWLVLNRCRPSCPYVIPMT